MQNIIVHENPKEVQSFLDAVRIAADAHRAELGFFPFSVYSEFARKGQLYVACERESNKYAGHLLFDCRHPRAKVLQMFVDKDFRCQGVAAALLVQLKISLTQSGFLSIYARVAEDLDAANKFWSRQNFYIQRIEAGGSVRNRTILVRVHELETPQLFGTSGLSQFNPLGLPSTRTTELPLYLIDLNILFDVGPRRPRHKEVAALYQAERMNFCRLAISSEARDELKRSASPGKTDPMESFIGLFPTFPITKDTSSELIKDLAKLVFPAKGEHVLSTNDLSDLSHVATAIQHHLAGLVTNDQAILQAAVAIQNRFGIRLVSSDAFSFGGGSSASAHQVDVLNSSPLESRPVQAMDHPAVHTLLSKFNLTPAEIASDWVGSALSNSKAKGIWHVGQLIGYLCWPARSPDGCVHARAAVDESHTDSGLAARTLLTSLRDELGKLGPTQVDLRLPPNQSTIRELAFGLGFSGAPSSNSLTKLSDGLQVRTPDGNLAHISLDAMESLLAPALFCLAGRPAVITPIQKSFSEPLLGHSAQSSFMPQLASSVFPDRHYVSSYRTLKHFSRGKIILFYESGRGGGRSALVAIAKVSAAFLRDGSQLTPSDYERSVLDERTLAALGMDKMKTVTLFDAIFHLPKMIPLSYLETIGCGKPTKLLSTNPITDLQFESILREAFSE
ncbi:MAG: GNAT family N-acetyltransferase [Burkholderiales bacterium]|nr:MAG: GNAT family N-acetyltransferase [Burkholderiales bacterium]